MRKVRLRIKIISVLLAAGMSVINSPAAFLVRADVTASANMTASSNETVSSNKTASANIIVSATDIASSNEVEISNVIRERIPMKYSKKDLPIVDTGIQLYSYDEMVCDINELTSEYGGILSSEVIGQSVRGRDIYAVTLGREDAQYHVMIQASIHGREYINTQVVMKLLEYYAYYYDRIQKDGSTYREIFENTAFHVIPMANPDGVMISQNGVWSKGDEALLRMAYKAYLRDMGYQVRKDNDSGEPEWTGGKVHGNRKMSFASYQKRWKANARGVDLNRNFNAKWSETKSKYAPGYTNYKGERPVSEPETRALVLYALKYDYKYYVNYHSKGQIIYYDCKGNTAELSRQEKEFAKRVSSIIKYDIVNTKKSDAADLGGFGDWIQLGVGKPSITIENGYSSCPVPVKEFDSIWNRHRELWAKIACMEDL